MMATLIQETKTKMYLKDAGFPSGWTSDASFLSQEESAQQYCVKTLKVRAAQTAVDN